MQEPLADAAREHPAEAAAVGRAEHDHVGVLVLGYLVQRARRRDAADGRSRNGVSPSSVRAAARSRSSASAIARS